MQKGISPSGATNHTPKPPPPAERGLARAPRPYHRSTSPTPHCPGRGLVASCLVGHPFLLHVSPRPPGVQVAHLASPLPPLQHVAIIRFFIYPSSPPDISGRTPSDPVAPEWKEGCCNNDDPPHAQLSCFTNHGAPHGSKSVPIFFGRIHGVHVVCNVRLSVSTIAVDSIDDRPRCIKASGKRRSGANYDYISGTSAVSKQGYSRGTT